MGKYCCHGLCKNDSRQPNAKNMTNRYEEPALFVRFPGKKRKTARVKALIHTWRRPAGQLNLTKLSYHHFICSLHFVCKNYPTANNPDPVPATLSIEQRNHLENAHQRVTGKHPLLCSEVQQQQEFVHAKTKIEPIESNNVDDFAGLLSSENNQEVKDALLSLSNSSQVQ